MTWSSNSSELKKEQREKKKKKTHQHRKCLHTGCMRCIEPGRAPACDGGRYTGATNQRAEGVVRCRCAGAKQGVWSGLSYHQHDDGSVCVCVCVCVCVWGVVWFSLRMSFDITLVIEVRAKTVLDDFKDTLFLMVNRLQKKGLTAWKLMRNDPTSHLIHYLS